MTEFEGLRGEVRDWFQGLEANNSREYFGERRDFFEQEIRDQMEAMLTVLLGRACAFTQRIPISEDITAPLVIPLD